MKIETLDKKEHTLFINVPVTENYESIITVTRETTNLGTCSYRICARKTTLYLSENEFKALKTLIINFKF